MTTAVFENEVVTAAKVRYLRLPGLSGEFALITIDNGHDHTRPSTFGPGGIASLDAARTERRRPGVVVPVVEGDQRQLTGQPGHPQVPDVGLRDDLVLEDGAHAATAPSQWGFSQITEPPMPMPMHMAVRP